MTRELVLLKPRQSGFPGLQIIPYVISEQTYSLKFQYEIESHSAGIP